MRTPSARVLIPATVLAVLLFTWRGSIERWITHASTQSDQTHHLSEAEVTVKYFQARLQGDKLAVCTLADALAPVRQKWPTKTKQDISTKKSIAAMITNAKAHCAVLSLMERAVEPVLKSISPNDDLTKRKLYTFAAYEPDDTGKFTEERYGLFANVTECTRFANALRQIGTATKLCEVWRGMIPMLSGESSLH